MAIGPGLGRTVLELATDSAKFFTDLDKVEARSKTLRGAFEATRKDLKGFGTEMTSVGKALTIGLSAPIAAIAATSIKAAVDFESSFAGVRKTVNATEAQFGQLATGFRNMAKEIPVNVNELNKIGEAAGQLGIKTENILGFTRVMADLGVTTNLSSDQAATALARLANITQMPQDKFDRLGSTIVALGNNFATTESEIVEMGLRIAGAGKQIGLTEGQILAVGTALSSVGIEAEAGGSAISKVMINMALAVSKGGKELKQFADVAGVSGAEFKQRFEKDAASALTAFITGLGNMKAAGGDVLGTLEAMGVTEVRMRDALLRTSGAGDMLTRALQLQGEAWDQNNALQKEAGERYKTTESQIKILKNQVNDAQMELGVHLLPILKSVLENLKPIAEKAGEMAEAFGKLPDPVKKVAIAIGLVGIVAGPTAIGVGQLAFALDALAASKGLAILSGIATKLGGATAGLLAFGGALGAVFQDQMVKAVMGGRDLNAVQADFAKVLGQTNKSLLPRFSTEVTVVAEATNKAADATKNQAQQQRELTEEQKKAIEAQRKLRDTLFGADDIRKAESYAAALGDTTNWLKLTSDAQEDVRKTLDAAMAAYVASGRAVPLAVARWYAASRDMRIETQKLADLAEDKFNPAIQRSHLLFIQSTEGIEYNTGKLADLADETVHATGVMEGQNQVVGQGIRQTSEWETSLGELAQAFSQMAQTAKGGLGAIAGPLAVAITSMDLGLKATNKLTTGFGNLKAGGEGAGRGAIEFATGLASAIAAMDQATSSASRLQNTMMGAAQGAAMGGQSGGVWGAIAGAFIGGIYGAMQDVGPDIKKLIAQWGEQLGFEVSESLAAGLTRGLNKNAWDILKALDFSRTALKEWGIATQADAQRAAAEISEALNLSAIIAEQGGHTTETLQSTTTKLIDLFTWFDRGIISAQELRKAIRSAFGDIANAVVESGQVASAEFLRLTEMIREYGIEVEALDEFLGKMASRVGTGLAAQLQPAVSKYEGLAEKIKEARKEVENFDAENAGRELGVGDSQAREEAVARLSKLLAEQKQGAEETAGAYDRIGLAVLASYNAGIAKGMDQLSLFEQLSPALDNLVALNKNLGLEAQNAGVQELINLRAKIDANKELVAAAQLHGETYAAMINLGVRDTEVLLSMQEGAVANYDALTAAGFTETEALVQMKGSLEAIRDAHTELGIPISENTQELLDQAEAAGVLGEKQVSAEERAALAMEKTADVLTAIARKMGVEIPEAADKMAGRIKGAIDKVPSKVPIEVEWEVPDFDVPHGGVTGRGNEPGGGVEPDQMHRGGAVKPYRGGYIGRHIVEAARAHTGLYVGLHANEVPIIARPDEGVLNDYAGMPSIAKWALALANRGEMPGGGAGGEDMADAVAAGIAKAGGLGAGGTLNLAFNGAMNERFIRDQLMPGILDILRRGGGTLTDWQVALGV